MEIQSYEEYDIKLAIQYLKDRLGNEIDKEVEEAKKNE